MVGFLYQKSFFQFFLLAKEKAHKGFFFWFLFLLV